MQDIDCSRHFRLTLLLTPLLQRLFFDLWYLFRPPWDSGVSPPELLAFLEQHPAGRAIDLGCGTGTNVITLAQHGWEVTGLDYSPRAIRIARRKVLKAQVRASLSVCDVTRLSGIGGPFDLGFDLGCFHSLVNRESYLANLPRILAPHGYWLVYGFLKEASGPDVPGIGPDDLAAIGADGLTMISRQDGTDRGDRPSAWFLFQRHGQ